jgi:aspartate ammonia-lyase
LGEIHLQELQQGSTIMPGKINPVMPEMTMQCAIRVIANDSAITMAAAHGDFELNAFFPIIADSLLESLQLLTKAVNLFRTRCIQTLRADEEQCRQHLTASAAFGTDYVACLGYDTVSRIIKEHSPEEARRLLEEEAKRQP